MTRSEPAPHPPGGNAGKADQRSTRQAHPRVSLALGGGGGRGIAHLGVLQAVSESDFVVERICGISIGAVAGALYATGAEIGEIQRQVLSFIQSPSFQRRQSQMFGATPSRGHGAGATGWLSRFKRIFTAHQSMTRAIRHAAILPSSVLQHVVDTLLPDIDIEDVKIPLSVVAVDLKSGKRVVLDRGPLREAVRASASIPGVFPPVPWEDQLLCDIGVFESVPVITAKQFASGRTIAVDVSDQVAPVEQCKNILEVFSRVQHLAECELRRYSLMHADIVIRPAIGRRPWFDFSSPEQLISIGCESAHQQLGSMRLQAAEQTVGAPTFVPQWPAPNVRQFTS
jgi:NTE family protein